MDVQVCSCWQTVTENNHFESVNLLMFRHTWPSQQFLGSRPLVPWLIALGLPCWVMHFVQVMGCVVYPPLAEGVWGRGGFFLHYELHLALHLRRHCTLSDSIRLAALASFKSVLTPWFEAWTFQGGHQLSWLRGERCSSLAAWWEDLSVAHWANDGRSVWNLPLVKSWSVSVTASDCIHCRPQLHLCSSRADIEIYDFCNCA